MSKEELFQKIRELLAGDFELDAELVTPDAKLYEDLELDSIDAIDLLVKMKEYVTEKIEPELFKKAVTVQDVVDILHPLLQKS